LKSGRGDGSPFEVGEQIDDHPLLAKRYSPGGLRRDGPTFGFCALGPEVTAYVTVISQRRRRVLAEELAACTTLEAQLGADGLRRAAA
jgi:hypothetical protein